MTQDITKIIAMASGQNRNDFNENEISSETRAKIDTAFENIFLGKSIKIWSKGGALVDAWNSALDELRSEIFAISPVTNIVQYLRIAVFAHRARWLNKMQSSDERGAVATLDDAQRTELLAHATEMIDEGNLVLRELVSGTNGARTQNTPQNVIQSNVALHTNNQERTLVKEHERHY